MSISQELFLSILAMDSYNRGYGAGISSLSEKSDGSVSIGNALYLEICQIWIWKVQVRVPDFMP